MDISNAERLMLQYGFDSKDIEEIRAVAESLPLSNISARIDGLDQQASLVLLSRLLRQVAPIVDVDLEHNDVIGLANFPVEDVPHMTAQEATSAAQ